MVRHLKDLYQLGHKPKQEYLADCTAIQRKLEALPEPSPDGEKLEKLARFLEDITLAREEAGKEQRNRLVSQLFEVAWVENKQLVAATPWSEFKPFFDLEYQAVPEGVVHIGHRRGGIPLSFT